MIGRALLAFLLVAALAVAAPSSASALPDGFEEQTIADGLNHPTAVAFAPASDGRMFIAEQPGRVKVRMPNGTVSLLLDWRDRINSFGDRGLVGIEADTDFGANGYLYILFVADNDAIDDDGPHSSRLVRLTVSPANEIMETKSLIGGDADQGTCPAPDGDHATTADAEIDCIPATATTHAIGTVVSDPRDGTLWFGSGDAESVAFNAGNRITRMRTYNEESFAGKVLHIDREGRGLLGHAFCPEVTDLDRVCTKVHAKGFRNPFRFTLPPTPGAPPIVADVGDLRREELNLAVKGGNYGWPCWEGSNIRPRNYSNWNGCNAYVSNPPLGAGFAGGTPRAGVLAPDFEYDHDGVDAAILAGPVYDGGEYPAEYRGSVFFGDYARGFVRRFGPGATPGSFDITPSLIYQFSTPNSSTLFMQRAAFTQLTSAPNGDLVVVDFLTPGPAFDYTGPGRVVRIVHEPENRAPVAVATVAQEEIAADAAAVFAGSASSDPDGDTLTYAWDFDDNGTVDSTEPNPTHVYAGPGVKTARLTVSDGTKTSTATVQVLVGVHRPRVTITAPVPGALYNGGAQVALAGGATDKDEPGGLSDERLRWEITLVHGTHTHPLVDIIGRTGSFTAWQDHGLDSRYRIRLIATDATGLEGSATVTIDPRPAVIRVESEPAGATIEIDEQAYVAPRGVDSAVGLAATVRAAPDFVREGVTWRFARWSDGAPGRERDYVVPTAGGTLTAMYARDPEPAPPAPPPASAPPASPAPAPPFVPAPPAPPSGAGDRTATPTVKPRLRLTTPWTARRTRVRTVSGTLTGVAGTPRIQVAVARTSGNRCRWWSSSRKQFGRATMCTRPVWTTARVRRTSSGWRYDAALRGTVTRQAGRIQVRALVSGRSVAKTTVRVSRPR